MYHGNCQPATNRWRVCDGGTSSQVLHLFFSSIFQLDYVNDLLQQLSAPDSDSSGEESAGEEKKEDAVDEEDQVERDNLSLYVSRFKVGLCEV